MSAEAASESRASASEPRLREREARYRSLAHALADIVWTTTADGNVEDAPEWLAYTGQSPDEARGWGWLDALHPDDRAAAAEATTTALAASEPFAVEYRVRRADGTYHWFRARGTPVRTDDGAVREWVGACVDIDREVRDAQGRALLARVAEVLAGALDERAALDAAARLAVEDPGARRGPFADACAIDLPVDGADGPPWFVRAALASQDPEKARLDLYILARWPMPRDARFGYAPVMRTGEPLVVPVVADELLHTLARDEEHFDALRALELHSVLCVPISARGRVAGVLSLVLHGSERRRPFDDADLAVAMELGRRIGVALETARLYQAELRARAAAERAAERARRLQRLTAALSEAVTPQLVADVILQEAMAAIGADAGTLALVRADGHAPAFELVRTTGFSPEVLERHRLFPIERGRPLSDAVLDATPVLLATPDEWRARYPELATEMLAFGWRGFVAVPVVAHGRVLAGLSFGFRIPQLFDEGMRTFLATLGEQCAQALERAWAFESADEARAAAERAVERIARLQELTAALSGALTPDQVARAVVEHGTAALGANAGVVVLLSDDGATLEVADASGFSPALLEGWHRFPLDTPVPIAEAVRTRETIVLETPEERARRYPTLGTRTQYSASASVPLLDEEVALGALGFSFVDPVILSASDRAYMLSLGRLCAQAIRRATLYAAAEAGSRAKSEFLATMSHELRTPLTAIIGYEELLADGITGPVTLEQRGQLARIKGSAMHLLNLIDEVLTFARVEAGKERVRRELVDVGDAMEAAAAIVSPLAAERRLVLLVRPLAPALAIETDRGKLQQILVNLLGNAVKFTEQGEVALTAAANETHVEFHVRDTGIGISPEHHEQIFEPFTQVESRTTRKFGGTGLGLSVTRQLVRLLDGEVTVSSTPGAGSTFVVRVPRRRAE